MKCPLKRNTYIWPSGQGECQFEDCLEEDCAWWEDSLKKCSVRVLAQFSVGASVYLHNISENMPFKAQL